MEKFLEKIYGHRKAFAVLAAVVFVVWLVIGSFGPQLGVDGQFREDFLAGTDRLWKGLVTAVSAAFAREVLGDDDEGEGGEE